MRRMFFTLIAVAAFAVTTDCAVAQPTFCPPGRVGCVEKTNRLFNGTRADVEAAAPITTNTAETFYDPATGDVIVNLGPGLSLLGLNGEPFLGENLTTDPAIIGFGLGLLPPPVQNHEAGIGFFNPAGLVIGIDFVPGAAAGPFNLGALLPAGLDVAYFDQFGGPYDSPVSNSLFLSYASIADGVGYDGFQIIAGTLTGDFDLDGDVDVDDIDFYSGHLGLSATGDLAQLDLDADGLVTFEDYAEHVTTLVETSNGQVGTLIGDANLDGTVDVLGDAHAFVGNLGTTSNASWSQGDFNADGQVDIFNDAAALVNNLRKSNANGSAVAASAVPEPTGVALPALALVATGLRRQR